MQHKVGTKIRIKLKHELQRLEDENRRQMDWSGLASAMAQYEGRIAKITEAYGDINPHFFMLDLDGQAYVWCDKMVESIEVKRNLPTWW